MPKRLEVLLRVLRLCSGRIAGACLFTELRRRFLFVQGDCVRTQVTDNGVSYSSLFIQSLANFLFPSPLQLFLFCFIYFPSQMLAQMQGCAHSTSTHNSAGVFAFPEKLCLCKKRNKFDPGFATSKVLLLIKLLTIHLLHWNDLSS